MRKVKLTPAVLRRIIAEERARLVAEGRKKGKKKVDEAEMHSDPKEVGPDGMADTLAMKKDHAKAVGVKSESSQLRELEAVEKRLVETLQRVRQGKRAVAAKIAARRSRSSR